MPPEIFAAIHTGRPEEQRQRGIVSQQLPVILGPRQPAEPHDIADLRGSQAMGVVALEENRDRLEFSEGIISATGSSGSTAGLARIGTGIAAGIPRVAVLLRRFRRNGGGRECRDGVATLFEQVAERAGGNHRVAL